MIEKIFNFFWNIVKLIVLVFLGFMIYFMINPVEREIEQSKNKLVIENEPKGDNKEHLDWLDKECEVNMKLIEENDFKKNAEQLGRRNFCTEAGEMRKKINKLPDSSSQGEKDFSISQITAHVSEYNEYPRIAKRRKMQGEVIIEIQVKGDGTLLSKYIKKSSGHEVLDMAAMDAIQKSLPLPAVHKSKNKLINLLLPFEYSLIEN